MGGCVEYLIDEGCWKRNKDSGIVTATGLGPAFKGKQERVIRWVEAEAMEDDLRELVVDTWAEVERACEVKRKSRYD